MSKTKMRAAKARGFARSHKLASKPMRYPDRSFGLGTAAALDGARRAGLLEGEKTAHVSFRATPALVEAAKRKSGVASLTELGILALAMLAQPDPVAAFLKRRRGRLGAGHKLEY
jgi:hypothetical protein